MLTAGPRITLRTCLLTRWDQVPASLLLRHRTSPCSPFALRFGCFPRRSQAAPFNSCILLIPSWTSGCGILSSTGTHSFSPKVCLSDMRSLGQLRPGCGGPLGPLNPGLSEARGLECTGHPHGSFWQADPRPVLAERV